MEGSSGRAGRAVTVLVADDDHDIVEYLTLTLRLQGFEVVGTATDADGVARLAASLHPDVVLLDLGMPGGGRSAATLISASSPTTRIVIFTADAGGSELLALLQSGIHGYVIKGEAPARLAEAIHSAVVGDAYLAPEVNRIAVGALNQRLQSEALATLRRDEERALVDDVIDATRFHPVHQPIIDLRTSGAVGVEALTRFTATPSRPPDMWFAAADRVGMKVPLELATATAALIDLDRLPSTMSMTLNFSPEAAVSGRLGEVLEGAPLDRIIIELTEHSPVEDYGALNDAIAPWRERGTRLAVDDAGSGYSSFAHILKMRPEFIKFDINLTHHIDSDRSRQALARALVGFASEMDVAVIAEGVESAAELDMVAGLGTPFAQGFHLGRPLPLDDQPALLAGTQGPHQQRHGQVA